MKKILLTCVNFNSYKELDSYLQSIADSFSRLSDDIAELDILISDNSLNRENIKNLYGLNVKVIVNDNIGYLSGAFSTLKYISCITAYDYWIISNVDLKVERNFFQQLVNLEIENNVGLIAPSIVSITEHKDRNPKVMNRYSGNKMKIFKILYKYPILHFLYERLLYPLKRYKSFGIAAKKCRKIYAGHGSFMILTKSFFQSKSKWSYPVFLFGEELYLAEEVRNHNMEVIYEPTLQVIDIDHVSTSKMKRKSYYESNLNAVNFIYETYYK